MNWLKNQNLIVVFTILGIAFAFYYIGGQEQCNVLIGGAMSYLVREAPTKPRI